MVSFHYYSTQAKTWPDNVYNYGCHGNVLGIYDTIRIKRQKHIFGKCSLSILLREKMTYLLEVTLI